MKRAWGSRSALFFTLSAFMLACGSSPPPQPPPAPAPPASASASSVDDHDGMAQHQPAPRPPPAGQTVTVAYGGHSVDVDVAKVANGAANAPLAAVWKSAFPNEDASALQFDLVGSDGFRPGIRPACSKPLVAKDLESAKVETANHDVSWDASLKMPRCYDVKALSRLEAKK